MELMLAFRWITEFELEALQSAGGSSKSKWMNRQKNARSNGRLARKYFARHLLAADPSLVSRL